MSGSRVVPTTPSFPDYPPTVPGLLAAGASSHAGRDAVITPAGRLTYGELDDLSLRLAARLVEEGIGKGSRVGVLFPNGVEWVLAWAAAARIGAVTVPVNTFYRPRELKAFLRHSDVQCVVGVGSFIHHDYLGRLEEICPELVGADQILTPELPQLRSVLLWGESDRPWAKGGLAGALDDPADGRLAAVVRAMGDDVAPGDDLFVTYTSGSTGEPKGVIHSHGGVIRHAHNLAVMSGLDADSRVWTPMPLCWVGGFSFSLLRSLTIGAAFMTQDVFEAGAALELMSSERVTHVAAWPGIAKTLMEHPDFAETDLTSVRGGSFWEAMPADRRPRDSSLTVTSLGMSETCGPHTFWTVQDEVEGSPEEYRGSFGHEVPGTEHRIIDPETGVDLPPGTEGEVLVRGYSLMSGMYKRERSTVFDADGWYHTGDRGYFRDGWFFFTGRQSDLIKANGSNVAPAEVERALLGVPGIKLAYVVGVPHPDRGEEVVALVVPWADAAGASDSGLEPATIREALRAELSSYKVPSHVFVLADADVPWLVSQKVDRRALMAMAAERVQSARSQAEVPA